MSTSNRIIPLEQAVPGMVLAEDLRHSAKGILLPRNIILTNQHIANLRTRGVHQICIESDTITTPAQSDHERERLRQRALQDIQHLFRHSNDDTITQELHDTILEYRLEKIG